LIFDKFTELYISPTLPYLLDPSCDSRQPDQLVWP